MALTGGELNALSEVEDDRQDREWLRLASLATFCRQTIWGQGEITAYQLLGWTDPSEERRQDEERRERVAIEMFCRQFATVTGQSEDGH